MGNKYHNTPCEYDGKQFASKAERDYYKQLLWRVKAGEIVNLECQPRFVLQKKPKITYVADFSFIENGKLIVIDVKGVETAVFRLKKKLFEATHPEIELRIKKTKEAYQNARNECY